MDEETVDLWALDEVHFQQQGSRCRMWVPPEIKDPIVYHHPTRKSVGYFGAVRLRDGKFLFRRETGRFNGETFWQFMKEFREASIGGAPRRSDQRQCRIPPSPASSALERRTRSRVSAGLLAALQPRAESHRASLETDKAVVPPQPLLRIS